MKHVAPDEIDFAPPLPRVGERTVQTYIRLHVRDWYLELAARKFFSHLPSVRKQAKALQKAISDYASSAWLRERSLDECPARHAGKVNAYCWAILRLHDHVPSFSTINETLRKK